MDPFKIRKEIEKENTIQFVIISFFNGSKKSFTLQIFTSFNWFELKLCEKMKNSHYDQILEELKGSALK